MQLVNINVLVVSVEEMNGCFEEAHDRLEMLDLRKSGTAGSNRRAKTFSASAKT